MGNDRLKPTKADRAHSVAKAVASNVPVVGPITGSLFEQLVTAPLTRRRDEWIRELDGRLEGLHERVKNLEQFRDEDIFTSVAVQAMVAATKTHEEEKRRALQNAVLNTALGQSPDEAKTLMFVAYVDQFTDWHLRVLDYLANPTEWFAARDVPLQDYFAASRRDPFNKAFPELPAELADQILRDLHARGLTVSDSLGGMVSGPSVHGAMASAQGREFLQFLQEPEAEL